MPANLKSIKKAKLPAKKINRVLFSLGLRLLNLSENIGNSEINNKLIIKLKMSINGMFEITFEAKLFA